MGCQLPAALFGFLNRGGGSSSPTPSTLLERVAQALNITVEQLTGHHAISQSAEVDNVVLTGINSISPEYPDITGDPATKTLVCFWELQPNIWAGDSYQPRCCTLRLDGQAFTLLIGNQEIDLDKTLEWLNTQGEITDGPETVTEAEDVPCVVIDCEASDLSDLNDFVYKGQL